jgi:hypothetical protein
LLWTPVVHLLRGTLGYSGVPRDNPRLAGATGVPRGTTGYPEVSQPRDKTWCTRLRSSPSVVHRASGCLLGSPRDASSITKRAPSDRRAEVRRALGLVVLWCSISEASVGDTGRPPKPEFQRKESDPRRPRQPGLLSNLMCTCMPQRPMHHRPWGEASGMGRGFGNTRKESRIRRC